MAIRVDSSGQGTFPDGKVYGYSVPGPSLWGVRGAVGMEQHPHPAHQRLGAFGCDDQTHHQLSSNVLKQGSKMYPC